MLKSPRLQMLNKAIRAGLRIRKGRGGPFEPPIFGMGVPRVGLAGAASLAAKLEDEELFERYQRSR